MLFHIGEAFIKTKCVKLRKFSPPLISTQTIYKADTYKQIKSLSNCNPPGIFPEFFYFRFLEEAMQEYLPNGEKVTDVVENSNDH